MRHQRNKPYPTMAATTMASHIHAMVMAGAVSNVL